MRVPLALMFLLAAITAPGLTMAQEAPVITEWTVPWAYSRPRDPYAHDEETVWFVGQRSQYIATLNPKTGTFMRVSLDSGVGPHNLIVDDDGTVWYAGNQKSHIRRYHPDDGEIYKIHMPTRAARDPHTLVFDHKGNIWFTLQGANMIGRLNKESEDVDLVRVQSSAVRPYGIIIAPDGTPWIALFGSNKLAKIDPDSMRLTEIVLPERNARPRRLVATSDGLIWYVDYAKGRLGVYDPASETFEAWDLPSGSRARPYGMAVDNQDRIWIVETGPKPNNFVGFDTKSRTFIASVPIPSGAGSVRHMMYYEPTNTVWFGTDANTIGRAELP